MTKHVLGLAILAALSGAAHAAPTVDEMWDTIKRQQKEIDALTAKQSLTEQKVEATADAVDAGGNQGGMWYNKTTLGGYGEHHFNNVQGGGDKVDAHRFVLFVNHEYSDNVRLFTELELEHSLAGDGKPGEVELEQAFIEWKYAENHEVNMGLFLLPVGILNETHEPDTFYGVERNGVEKDIIPTTWWETGVMMSGQIVPGFGYDFAVHSGLNATAENGIRKGRQKSAEASAESLAYTGRLKYTGVAGLELSATVQYQEDMSQDVALEAESGVLTELHAVYQAGPFAVKALYAAWDIDGADYKAKGSEDQTGYYVEPSFKILDNLGVFARYSSWNTMPDAVAIKDREDKEAIDLGINFWLVDRVVIKADYQIGQSDNLSDSLNLGIGWSF